MDIKITAAVPEQIAAEAVAAIVFEDGVNGFGAVQDWLDQVRSSGEFTGKLYDLAILHRPNGCNAQRFVAVGGGKRENFGTVEARRAAGALVRSLKNKGIGDIALVLPDTGAEMIQAAVEGAVLGQWEPNKYQTDSKKGSKTVHTFTLVSSESGARLDSEAVERGRIVAQSQNLTRELVNEPPNRLTPADLADACRAVASGYNLECDVLDTARMRQLGMGALLGVAQGSSNEPYLVVLKYRPSVQSRDHLAFVGKGVTFDSGGLSIKPADSMEKMKYDMAGAAAVLGAMQAIAQLKPAVAVSAYIPTVENMVSGGAQHPGDIVKTLAGKTVEVLNTDAEGRLILADAIAYAKQNGATHLVDAATLTGAINVALGAYNMGAFTNDQAFLERFLNAARAAGEKAWQLPMDEEYKDYLKSAFADIPNVGPRAAGSITAAWFLREFADPTPWVHLDIASTAWLDDAKPWQSKGPSGVPLRSLVRLATEWT